MTIIKQAHRRQYFSMANELAQNKKLSLRARGLMAYLLSLPDHWEMHLNHLVKEMQEGRHIIRETLIELKKAGYIHHLKLGFKSGWQYFVFETPHTEEQFKDFLRTIRFPNSSISEQFEDRPLERTDFPRKNLPSKKNPPLTPPKEKTKKEEDFSSKKKKREKITREQELQQVVTDWKLEGRPDKVIEACVSAYKQQPHGKVHSISAWMEKVYQQKFECADADELYEHRRKFAEKMDEECRNNYFFDKSKDILCYTHGSVENIYDIKGNKKQAEAFWEKHNLGKRAFLEWKCEQRRENVANSV